MPSPDISDRPTPTHFLSGSDNYRESDNGSEATYMEMMMDCPKDTYVGKIYFPDPFLFDEVDFMYDSISFGEVPRFNRDLVDNKIL